MSLYLIKILVSYINFNIHNFTYKIYLIKESVSDITMIIFLIKILHSFWTFSSNNLLLWLRNYNHLERRSISKRSLRMAGWLNARSRWPFTSGLLDDKYILRICNVVLFYVVMNRAEKCAGNIILAFKEGDNHGLEREKEDTIKSRIIPN